MLRDYLLLAGFLAVPAGLGVGIGAGCGFAVFRGLLNEYTGVWTANKLSAVSAAVSAVVSGVAGFLVALGGVTWINSQPRGTSDTGTMFGLLLMLINMTLVSAVVGGVVGTGLGRAGLVEQEGWMADE